MNLKKYYPFIIPVVSLLLVIFLAFRWYNLRTQRDKDLKFNEVKIENLTPQDQIVIGSPDTSTVSLKPENEELATGQVRYRIVDERVLFSVSADLAQIDKGAYQVWISTKDQVIFQKAFVLEYGKGGYVGSASVSKEQLPLEIIVSQELTVDDQIIEQELLRGVIDASSSSDLE